MKTRLSRITHASRISLDTLLAFSLFIATLALYARTAAPGLLDGDEGEFQTNIYKLGVSHTGYPLFFLLGKLFTMLVPIGTAATRANLFAAFWGALTVALLYFFMRWLTANRWAGVITALLLAVSRVEWSQAIIPRPYTLNSFLVILITFLFFLWRVGKVDLTVPVFVFGLSLTNHRTMIWFAPAIALFVLWHARGAIFQPRRLASLMIAFVAPLILYGYVFWRGDSDVGVEFHMKDFGDMILAGNASRWMNYGGLDWIVPRVTDLYIPLLVEQFTMLGIIAGLIGIVALALNRSPRDLPARAILVFILLANTGNSLFCIFFNTIDVEKFFLPSYITFLFLIGIGIASVWDWLAAQRARRVAIAQGAIFLMFIGVSGFLIRENYSRNDWSDRTDVAAAWEENLAQPLEKHALIIGPWESLTPLEYAWYVDGRRTDLERWKVITQKEQLALTNYGSRQQDIEREVRVGRPVYMTVDPRDTETLGALADEFRLTRVGDLWRVLNLPPIAALPQTRPISQFTDQAEHSLELLSHSIYPAPQLRAGDFGLLTLFWRAPQGIGANLSVSFRLMDSQDRVVYQRDSIPANGTRPTIGWAPDEIVQDDVGFFVPPDVAPGAYYLALVVYNPANGEEWMSSNLSLFTVNELQIIIR